MSKVFENDYGMLSSNPYVLARILNMDIDEVCDYRDKDFYCTRMLLKRTPIQLEVLAKKVMNLQPEVIKVYYKLNIAHLNTLIVTTDVDEIIEKVEILDEFYSQV